MTDVGLPEASQGAGVAAAANRDWRAKLPFFYGWLIVAGSLVALGLTYSVWYSFSVFYVALLEEFQWSRAASAGVFSLFVIVSGIGSPVAGALVDRFGPGRVVAAGGVILATGLLISSRLTELWQYYLSFGVVAALGISACGWTPCVTMINRWFSARLGVALGIASAGIGVGILVVVPVVQALIGGLGWRAAYISLAALVFVGLLPIGLLLLRGRPEDLGLRMDGGGPLSATPSKSGKAPTRRGLEIVDQEWVDRSWTLGSALRTRRYWLLCGVKLLGNIGTQMIFVHQVAYLVDGGHDRMMVASVVGLVGLLSVGAKILWGWAADTIGREMAYTLGSVALVLAIGILILTRLVPSPAMLYIYAVIFALGYGVSAPLWPIVTSDLFAGPRFGSIYGFIGVFSGLGSALGAWFAGYVFDLAGSYTFAFAVAAAAKAISAAVMWIVAPRKVRRVRKPTAG